MIAIKFGWIQIPCPAPFLWAESLGMSLCDRQKGEAVNVQGRSKWYTKYTCLVTLHCLIHAEDFKIVSIICY